MKKTLFAALALCLVSAFVSVEAATPSATPSGRFKPESAAPDAPKVSILGDSYSTYAEWVRPVWNICWYRPDSGRDNDVRRVEDTWWYRFIDENGFRLERNNSFSGSTVCLTGYEGHDYSDRAFISRVFDLGSPDIIIVFGGTNDDWAGAPLGTYKYADWTKADLYCVRPAFAYLLDRLRQYYPAAEIYNVTNCELSPAITESFDVICNKYGVPNVKLRDIDKQLSHPSVEGMKTICAQLTDVVRASRK